MSTEPRSQQPSSSPKGLSSLVGWGAFWVILGLCGVMLLPTIEEAMGLSFVRYRRYRYSRASRYQGPGSLYQVKISKISTAGRIDQKKLRLSIKQKLKRIARCYETLVTPPKQYKPVVRRRRYYRRPKPPKKRRAKRKSKKKDKNNTSIGTATVALELNSHGRATSTQLRKSSLAKRFQHCFVWFFRGRKFFPPESNRSIKLRISLRLEKLAERPKPGVSARGTLRKRGGKW